MRVAHHAHNRPRSRVGTDVGTGSPDGTPVCEVPLGERFVDDDFERTSRPAFSRPRPAGEHPQVEHVEIAGADQAGVGPLVRRDRRAVTPRRRRPPDPQLVLEIHHRHLSRDRSTRDARHLLNPRDELRGERFQPGIRISGQRHLKRQSPIRVVSRIHSRQLREAPDQEPSGDDEHHRQRRLGGHKPAASTKVAEAPHSRHLRTRPFAQDARLSGRRSTQRRHESAAKTTHQREKDRERDGGPVDCHVVEPGEVQPDVHINPRERRRECPQQVYAAVHECDSA